MMKLNAPFLANTFNLCLNSKSFHIDNANWVNWLLISLFLAGITGVLFEGSFGNGFRFGLISQSIVNNETSINYMDTILFCWYPQNMLEKTRLCNSWILNGYIDSNTLYLNITLDKILDMSNSVITSLQEFLKCFGCDGVAKFSSENVALLVL